MFIHMPLTCLNVDATSQQIGANQIAAVTLTEIVENAVAMMLRHL